MPVLGQDAGGEAGRDRVDHRHHRIAVRHFERAPRAEIVLDVDDHQRGVFKRHGRCPPSTGDFHLHIGIVFKPASRPGITGTRRLPRTWELRIMGSRASRPQRAGGAGFSGIPTLGYYKTCGCRDGAPPKAVASCRRRIFRTRTSPPALLSGGPPAHLRAGRPCPKRHAAPRGPAAPTQPPGDERFFVTLLRISRMKVYIPRGSPAARRWRRDQPHRDRCGRRTQRPAARR